jgi:hypothetical protein
MASKLRATRNDFITHGKNFENETMWSLRSWYWVWKMQGFPENGYQILRRKMLTKLSDFNDVQKEMWKVYGQPSMEFKNSKEGNHNQRIRNIRDKINAMFLEDASNVTISEAWDLVTRSWRDFSLEFISVKADPKGDKKMAETYDFEENYNKAREALFSYGEGDSIRGLLTFSMNRVSWGGIVSEK